MTTYKLYASVIHSKWVFIESFPNEDRARKAIESTYREMMPHCAFMIKKETCECVHYEPAKGEKCPTN